MSFNSAAKYSATKRGLACVIRQGGVERVAQGSVDTPRDIESCSKSFASIMAQLAKSEGLIPSLDVKVSTVLTELIGTPKEHVTLRQLLSLTSGWSGGRTGSNPTYQEAILAPFSASFTGRWLYGPNPVNAAAEFFDRLAKTISFPSWRAWLETRLLALAGVTIAFWDYVAPGQPHLAGGAHMTARQLTKLGDWLRTNITPDLIQPHTIAPDPLYGVTLWLCMDSNRSKPLPDGAFALGGANNQRLYVFPARGIVAARLGEPDSTWSDEEFVSRLLA